MDGIVWIGLLHGSGSCAGLTRQAQKSSASVISLCPSVRLAHDWGSSADIPTREVPARYRDENIFITAPVFANS